MLVTLLLRRRVNLPLALPRCPPLFLTHTHTHILTGKKVGTFYKISRRVECYGVHGAFVAVARFMTAAGPGLNSADTKLNHGD